MAHIGALNTLGCGTCWREGPCLGLRLEHDVTMHTVGGHWAQCSGPPPPWRTQDHHGGGDHPTTLSRRPETARVRLCVSGSRSSLPRRISCWQSLRQTMIWSQQQWSCSHAMNHGTVCTCSFFYLSVLQCKLRAPRLLEHSVGAAPSEKIACLDPPTAPKHKHGRGSSQRAPLLAPGAGCSGLDRALACWR